MANENGRDIERELRVPLRTPAPCLALALLCLLALLLAPAAAAADAPGPTAWDKCRTQVQLRMKQGALVKAGAPAAPDPTAVAYFVNGFTGCCIPKRVQEFLDKHDASTHESN
jgi:hypothetical protein